MAKAGFEYLLAYKITVPIYDYTIIFCKKYRNLLSLTRTYDQMVQAARSGMTNIPEGYQQASLQGYVKLAGVNKGSLEELLKDYLSFARQNRIAIWSKERTDLTQAVNLMITLTNQATFLQRRLMESLEQKFIKEGGFRENLFKKRMEFRNQKSL